MLDISEKDEFSINNSSNNNNNSLNNSNSNSNNSGTDSNNDSSKVFVIKSVDIYNTSPIKSPKIENSNNNNNKYTNHHDHKIRKKDYIKLSKEDEDEITSFLDNTPNLDINKEITIIKNSNNIHIDDTRNSADNSDNSNHIHDNSSEKDSLIINNINNSGIILNSINNGAGNDGANNSLNLSNEKSLLSFNSISYQQQEEVEEDYQDNIKDLKDCNNIEMDYVDLDASNNNILKKSLRNLQFENPLARKRSNKLKELFSIKFIKTIILVFMISNLGYGTFFSYTSPEALSHTFYNKFSITSNQFGSLFTLYAIPNVFMVFLSGIIVDIVGTDKVSIVLSSIVVLSTLIGALSPPNYGVMLFSRFLLGFAGESLVACSNTMMSKWFSAKTLSLSMGVLVGWIYSANFISLTVLPAINKSYGFNTCLWVIFFVSVFGIVLNVVYLVFKKRFNDVNNKYEDGLQLLSMDYLDKQSQLQDQFNNKDNHNNEDTGIILITDLNNESNNSGSILNSNGSSGFKLKLRESLRKIASIFKEIPVRMWIIVGIVFFGYTALFGLAIIGPDFLNQKYGYDEQKAALILSSEHVCSALFSPICGVLIKKVSKRITVLFVSLLLFGIGLSLLLFTSVFPLPWIIICGIGYSILNTTIISSLPIFVPDEIIGTCYGFVGTSYNFGLIVFPILLGTLKESTGNYNLSVSILILNSIVAALLVGLLKYFDLKSSPSKRLDK